MYIRTYIFAYLYGHVSNVHSTQFACAFVVMPQVFKIFLRAKIITNFALLLTVKI